MNDLLESPVRFFQFPPEKHNPPVDSPFNKTTVLPMSTNPQHVPPMLTAAAAATATLTSQGFAKIAAMGMTFVTTLLAAMQTQEMQSAQNAGVDTAMAEHVTLRLWCLAGAMGGAVAKMCMHPGKTAAASGRSFMVSVITGLFATPFVFQYFSLTKNADYVLPAAAALAFSASFLLETGERMLRKWVKARADKATE